VRQAVRKIDDSGGVQVPRPGEVLAPAAPDIPRLYAGVIPPAVRGAAEDLHSAILAGCPPGSAREGALRALRAEVVTQAQRAYEGPP
jgi:hypothetical protein